MAWFCSKTVLTYTALFCCLYLPVALAASPAEQCGSSILQQAPFRTYTTLQSCSVSLAEDVGPKPSRWSPWTHRPYCAGSEYCVFTNSMFHGRDGSGGISFVAAPDRLSEFLPEVEEAFVAFRTRSQQNATSRSYDDNVAAPYRLEDVPGKGKGLVASRKIPRGEILMTDHAVAMVENDLHGMTGLQAQLLLAAAVDQLPDPEQVLSLAQNKRSTLGVAENVLRTNSFNVDMYGHKYMALFARVSVSPPFF